MATIKYRQRNHFRGPVLFGSAGDAVDSTWYGDTASSVMVWDASADEVYLDGADLWLKDDDQLEFGDASDVVVDWDNSNSRLLFNVASGGKVEFNRNLTAGSTSAAVVYVKQDNASDDQPALQVDQDASLVPAVSIGGWTKLGWSTSDPSGAVTAGCVRVISANSKYWLALAIGSSTYRFVELAATTTA